MISRILSVAVLVLVGSSVCAADAPTLSDVERKKAAELIQNLGADDFAVRNSAAEELAKMNAGVIPMLRETAAATKDAEVKLQIDKILKKSALQSETDPAVLAKYGKDEATARRYAEAAPYYEKAAKLYREAAVAEKDAAKQKELTDLANKATERGKRATLRSKTDVNNGRARVVAGGGAGAGMAVVRVEVSGEAGEKVDLTSEEW